MPGNWRALRPGDIAEVKRIAAAVHPDFPEKDEVFAERLRLAPQGCFLLELEGDACGYLLSHPWFAGDLPPLDALLGGVPEKPETWYLHDIALMPQARSKGQTTPIIAHLLTVAAGAGLPSASLVAVNNAQPFWSRFGFVDASTEELRPQLRSYGDTAVYMVRTL